MGLLDSVTGGILGAFQLSQAGKIHPQYNPYQVSPYAKDNLANAENAYNGRMAGAGALEQNILANEANTNANVDRTAGDGSQALAVKAATQGQTNASFRNLQTTEAQQKYQLLNNLNLANTGMTNENDKMYQDKLMKYQLDSQQQSALRNAGITNIAGAVNGLDSSAMMMSMMGGGGGGQRGKPGGGSNLMQMLPFLL